MPDERPSSDPLWLSFAVASVVSLAVLAVSPVKDYFREYRSYQKAYRERLLALAGSAREVQEAQAEGIRIRQFWIPELGARVDRCPTCHLGVDDPRMVAVPPPFRSHPVTPHTPGDFPRFGCTSCHRGQGRATTRDAAHGDVEDWAAPVLPLPYTEASCGSCHLGDQVAEASLLTQGRALMDRAGCYGCHNVPGREERYGEGPDLDGLAEKTHPEWLGAWLADPEALRPGTSMPDFQLSASEIEALVAYLWAQPSKASKGEENLPAGDGSRGQKLFRESRCISCHTVNNRGNGSAPELGGIGSKVDRRWLFAFLGDPHAFQPDTAMPRYAFRQEDLLDLTQYLTEELVDPSVPRPGPAYRPPLSLVEEGGELYVRYGCAGCHRIAGQRKGAKTGPDLAGVGDKPVELLDFGAREDLPRGLPAWLAAKVAQPRSFREGLKMPDFGFSPADIQALVTALLSLTGEPLPESYRVAFAPADYAPAGRFGTLVRQYRCLSCHEVRGAGGDLSTAPLTAEGSKVKRSWLEGYLLLPTTIRPILAERMIPLWLPKEEAAFLADYMENVYLDDTIPGEIFPDGVSPEQAERGRRLFFERYGCQACHQVGGTGGYYGPPLDDSPEKLESGWIAWWLKGPQRWRADVRCPDYGLDEADARDLAAFLVALAPAGKDGDSAAGGAP